MINILRIRSLISTEWYSKRLIYYLSKEKTIEHRAVSIVKKFQKKKSCYNSFLYPSPSPFFLYKTTPFLTFFTPPPISTLLDPFWPLTSWLLDVCVCVGYYVIFCVRVCCLCVILLLSENMKCLDVSFLLFARHIYEWLRLRSAKFTHDWWRRKMTFSISIADPFPNCLNNFSIF